MPAAVQAQAAQGAMVQVQEAAEEAAEEAAAEAARPQAWVQA